MSFVCKDCNFPVNFNVKGCKTCYVIKLLEEKTQIKPMVKEVQNMAGGMIEVAKNSQKKIEQLEEEMKQMNENFEFFKNLFKILILTTQGIEYQEDTISEKFKDFISANKINSDDEAQSIVEAVTLTLQKIQMDSMKD